ncbi:9219_t:CDS:2 [Acaulospora colombiana]|uniref:9219_t:CDS:1 n=1 Tax=Acaulospora colombiana TaxID=27376 RepID=A0ACA9MVI9_9GLOM|nr:9219_t:CDS:2 [Acaulospora colombiana]
MLCLGAIKIRPSTRYLCQWSARNLKVNFDGHIGRNKSFSGVGKRYYVNIPKAPQIAQKGSVLEEFGYDLTKLAMEGKLDPVIGREEEIRRTIQGISNEVPLAKAGLSRLPASIERREKLQKELKEKQKEYDQLVDIWQAERAKLEGIKKIKSQLEQARIELESAQRKGDLSRASELRYGVIPELEKKLPKESDETSNESLIHEYVTADDIGAVVSRMTGIPIHNLLRSERDRLIHMEEKLSERVVGQKEAIKAVSEAVRMSRAGLQNPSRPIASFLFLGPTGTPLSII